jgi:hypothetical protein
VSCRQNNVFPFDANNYLYSMWYPQIQFTFRYYDPSQTPAKSIWKSVNVTNFVTPPAKLDKRSSKSDQFTITLDSAKPDTYVIQGSYEKDVSVSITFDRAPGVPGFKLGAGPRGGITYFGPLKNASSSSSVDTTSGTDGFVAHRFWPHANVGGIVRLGDQVVDLQDSRGIFIHAIQGMRPNLVASRWNFAHFQSSSDPAGTSLTTMEFTTTGSHGFKTVTVGCIVVDGELVAVSAGNGKEEDQERGVKVTHEDVVLDPETGYKAPGGITFRINGRKDDKSAKAVLKLNLKDAPAGGTYQTRGLIEKVDVLAQIPYLVKKVVNVVAGTKPYIYTVSRASFSRFVGVDLILSQWSNKAQAEIVAPDGEKRNVDGYVFNEVSSRVHPVNSVLD